MSAPNKDELYHKEKEHTPKKRSVSFCEPSPPKRVYTGSSSSTVGYDPNLFNYGPQIEALIAITKTTVARDSDSTDSEDGAFSYGIKHWNKPTRAVEDIEPEIPSPASPDGDNEPDWSHRLVIDEDGSVHCAEKSPESGKTDSTTETEVTCSTAHSFDEVPDDMEPLIIYEENPAELSN